MAALCTQCRGKHELLVSLHDRLLDSSSTKGGEAMIADEMERDMYACQDSLPPLPEMEPMARFATNESAAKQAISKAREVLENTQSWPLPADEDETSTSPSK